ncbi:MAG: hypothetical protein ACPGVJ_04720, partial [Mangrovicoccus sp.]
GPPKATDPVIDMNDATQDVMTLDYSAPISSIPFLMFDAVASVALGVMAWAVSGSWLVSILTGWIGGALLSIGAAALFVYVTDNMERFSGTPDQGPTEPHTGFVDRRSKSDLVAAWDADRLADMEEATKAPKKPGRHVA